MEWQHTLQFHPRRRLARAGVLLAMTAVVFSVIFLMSNAPPTYPVESGQAEGRAAQAAVEKMRAETLFAARRKIILKTLTDAPADEWAGEYRYVDELESETFITWSRRYGFVFWKADGTLVLPDFDFGHAVLQGEQLQLISERAPMVDAARQFFAVRWGVRRYLVPSDRMIDFCHAAYFGRTDSLKQFPLKQGGDDPGAQQGLPDVPEQYKAFLNRSRLLQ
ncbi:MAG: hypothetical protein H7Z38_18320 [Rubrivivax sp.]|nr:hypothetical protein [Pyrinomonadaceae bacterium]